MSLERFKTQVLLLHSEQSTLDNLSAGFSDRYTVHCATSGSEALNTLGDTPIHVIVSAQDLPGMSGLEALREAKKRSPDTIGILLAGNKNDGLEALVGEKEVFQIVRGNVTADSLCGLIDNATQQVRLLALAESANDTTANVDEPMAENIVMETSEDGSAIISDGTGRLPILNPEKVAAGATLGTRAVDVLVLTKDEEFLATIRDSAHGLHNVYHANTPAQAGKIVRTQRVGVAVIDAAMVGSKVEEMTMHLRTAVPRLVAIVAGRRDDGEMLMELINRGKVYRFLLKPVSPGRARLAVEASVKHHLEAPDTAFKIAGNAAPVKVQTTPKAAPRSAPKPQAAPQSKATPQPNAKLPLEQDQRRQDKPVARPAARQEPTIEPSSVGSGLSDAFDGDDSGFTKTTSGIAASAGTSFADMKQTRGSKGHDAAGNAADGSGGSLFQNPKVLGMSVAALVAITGLTFWLFGGSDESVAPVIPVPPAQESLAETPSISAADPVVETPTVTVAEPSSNDLLDEARLARSAGQIFNPPGSNAIELYLAAAAAAPDDAEIASEFDAVIQQALSMAESALLDRQTDNAAAALQRVELASPDNSRLPFLTAQLAQIQLRNFLDDARLAIRESRFEDAAVALSGAGSLEISDTSEIDSVTAELSDARSQQRVDDVLAQASTRLEEGNLVEPSNDNARYYFELVLSNAPDNIAARQGLTVIASKLVLQARAQIDQGEFDSADALLADARELDPSSSELAESLTALETARDQAVRLQRAAAQRAEAERVEAQRAEAQRAAVQRAEAEAAEAERAEMERRTAAEQAARETTSPATVAEAAVGAAAGESAANSAGPPIITDAPDLENNIASSTATEPPIATPAEKQAAQVAQDNTPVGLSSLNRIKYVAPKYPRSAERRSISGWVDVIFTVTLDGLVRDIDVRASEPGDTFVDAATRAVEDWEFEPIIENGVAVQKRAAVRMMFAIE